MCVKLTNPTVFYIVNVNQPYMKFSVKFGAEQRFLIFVPKVGTMKLPKILSEMNKTFKLTFIIT